MTESDTPKANPSAETVSASSHPETESMSFGHFRLLRLLGEGGMGTVWLADQLQPVKRRVAIKIIKQGWTPSLSWHASRPNDRRWQ